MNIKLVCEDGRLCVPRDAVKDQFALKHLTGNPLLLAIYDSGDCDTVRWPNPDMATLRAALYGERETGLIAGDTRSVLLPNGVEFFID